MRAVVPLSRAPESLSSAFSSALRLYEEYGVDGFSVVPTAGDVRGEAGGLARFLEWATGLGAAVEEPLDLYPERLVEGVDPLRLARGILRGYCDGGAVVAVSPAGRWAATTLAIAAARVDPETGCSLDVAHVHFYFGPWRGLAYPYVPRRLEPVIVVHPQRGPAGEPGDPGYLERLALHWRGGGCEAQQAPRGVAHPALPPPSPLRCAVAETARRLNRAGGRAVVEGGGGKLDCGVLEVRLGGERGEARLCDPGSVAGLVRLMGRWVAALGEEYSGGGRPQYSPVAWAGLSPLKGLENVDGVVVDTNLLYYGVHLHAWEGLRVAVPECAVLEVERGVAEAVKRGSFRDMTELARALAYLALLDLRAPGSGAEVLPSLPGSCDAAIPHLDPLQLLRYKPATADEGAHRFWRSHQRLRAAGVEPVKASFDPYTPTEPAGPTGVSRVYYALIQGMLLLDLASKRLEPPGRRPPRASFTVKTPGGRAAPLHPATGMLEEALGLS